MTLDEAARQRLQCMQATEWAVMEAAAAGRPVLDLLEIAVRGVEQLVSGGCASLLLVNEGGQSLRFGAGPSLAPEYAAAMQHVPVGPCAGSCGTAIFRREPVIVEDIATDPLWEIPRAAALAQGYRACWSTPVLAANGSPMASIAVYFRESRPPTPEERAGVERTARLVALAMERERRERALARNRDLLRIAGQTAKLGGWSLSVPGFELRWSDETAAIHGEPAGFSPSYERALDYYEPAWRPALRSAFRNCIEQGARFEVEAQLRTRLGATIWVRTIGEAIRDDARQVAEIHGAIQDITDQKRTEERLARINRLYAVLSRVDECIARRPRRAQLFETICRVAVAQGKFRLAAVMGLDEATGDLRPLAHAGEGEDYLRALGVNIHDPARNGGTMGPAVRTQRYDVCNHIAADPRMRPCWEQAAAHEFRSAASFPIFEGRRLLGLFVLFAAETDYFQADEIDLLLAVQNDLAFAIEAAALEEKRRRTEAALADAQRQQDLILRSMGEGIHGLDAGGRVIFENPAAAAMFGRPAAGPGVSRHHHADNPGLAAAACPICLTLRDGVTRRVEEGVFFRPDGTAFPVEYVCSPLRDEREAITGAVVCFRDIAERRRAEEKLREQADLLDAAYEAILVKDMGGRIVYWNKGAERTYGWSPAEALGRNDGELFGVPASGMDAAMARLAERGAWAGEMAKRTKDGRTIPVESRWTLVRDTLGAPKSILAFDADITERKKLEQQFLRAQRLESLGTLAGGIAHDLNNLLAPITMGVGLLRLEETSPANLEVIASIEQSATRGAHLVKQVLSFARGVDGARVRVDLAGIVHEVQSIITSTLPKNIHIEVRCAPDLHRVLGDGTQLQQVLLNLCVNARDAMPDGGELALAARNAVSAEPAGVQIEVSDTGGGIPAENIDRIFEPFFTTKEQGKGTGLGLSTALGIVRSHGGTLSVTSTPGRGSCFKVCLPALIEGVGAAPEQAGAGPAAARSGRGECVLVVDDEAAILRVAGRALEAFGYQALLAGSGEEAVRAYAANKHRVKAIISDMMMPGMDGPTLIATLRQINGPVPIIAASGLSAEDQRDRAARAGARYFLPKPYSADAMLREVRLALDAAVETSSIPARS
ncbi:MAG TPA: PAS domain S-box protein [Opitutaceae bacterium]|jgi:PAS domain S-box-containing protein|nr:PAS domain S-box protein [Opitutaceae bacterium]